MLPGGGKPARKANAFKKEATKRKQSFWSGKYVWSTFLFPVFVFFLLINCYCWLFFYYSNVVNTVVAIIFLVTVLGVAHPGGEQLRAIMGSLLCVTILSIFCGLYVFDTYGMFKFLYENSRTYQNVVPSEPAAAVADAGKLVFAEEASIDAEKAVGFAAPSGITYCVAPIRDLTEKRLVEFWAVGVGCCAYQGDFTCDSAQDPAARGGVRVFDNNGWFQKSRQDYYDKARKKAEAEYNLLSAGKVLYVRWVPAEQLNMLQQFYEQRAWLFIVIATAFFGLVFFSLSYVMHRFTAKEEIT